MASEPPLIDLSSKEHDSDQDLSEWTDQELVERCQAIQPLDLSAYQELVRRHESLVFNTCLKIIRSYQDAEEVCQDTFVQVYHRMHQFEHRAAFKTWLFRIVYNLCLRRRETMSRRVAKETAAGENLAHRLKEKEQETDSKIQLSQTIEEAMDRLDEDQREIIFLKYISGLTLQEIADVLKVSLSAAKMRLYRSLDRFKESYVKLDHQSAA
ncbi:RNA polymerase sigma factor [Verrucomicrobiales bacterium]|nr:RNA polymerase sigma factor [Verrucomicrobiales bacterium]